ncbi:MAG: DUF192 domain-containing protein [Melioribacteraceae bacterium]|nr:DUF192 domain-containing protein [Melioribacteraceae bacterium]
MSKKKTRKANKNQSFFTIKNILVGIVIVSFAGYFIANNFISSPKQETKTLKRFTGFDFQKEGELTFSSAENEFINKIDIEIADTPEQRQVGLMYRVKMREDRGMLFIFDDERPQSFWMRNTEISLDILFVNKDMEIVRIHKNTQPFTETSYPSVRPALYVVEVNAGYTDRNNIKEGDKIVWRRI